MLRQAFIAATLTASTTAYASLIKIDYRFDYDHSFERLSGVTTSLVGHSGTGSIVFDTNEMESTESGVEHTLWFHPTTTWAPSTWSPAFPPVPAEKEWDSLALTLTMSGPDAGVLSLESNLFITWEVGTSTDIDHMREQTLYAHGTFAVADPNAPTDAELLAMLQSTVGKPGDAETSYEKRWQFRPISYTDVFGAVTLTHVTAVPEVNIPTLMLTGMCVAGAALRRRNRV